MATAMEDRLDEYRRGIEGLGFTRNRKIGKPYSMKQGEEIKNLVEHIDGHQVLNTIFSAMKMPADFEELFQNHKHEIHA
jgi:hypothetical protein